MPTIEERQKLLIECMPTVNGQKPEVWLDQFSEAPHIKFYALWPNNAGNAGFFIKLVKNDVDGVDRAFWDHTHIILKSNNIPFVCSSDS